MPDQPKLSRGLLRDGFAVMAQVADAANGSCGVALSVQKTG
jgi:hypothetical protein